MRLGDAIADLPLRSSLGAAAADTEVTGVQHDSRRVVGGDVFVAWRGELHDGRVFVPDAVARGATIVLHEPSPGIVAGGRRSPRSHGPGGRAALRPPGTGALGHRRHRHERQEHDLPVDRRLPDPVGSFRRGGRHAWPDGPPARFRAGGLRVPEPGGRGPHHAGEQRSVPHVAPGRGPGRTVGGDRGLVPCPRPGADERHGVRCRRVHQSDQGPSRLPPVARGLL